ncbi:two component transcriptional regulator, winged helix family [Arcobacter nitrofigilis DSM 7299]|uniref:Two component transcriptional regulator, winged helix family n=1 Tax=Arcobacter nitrofigilis (strain ATCC 33309 / DSM 7299 / CCUG 15893 / LMG 7604 / NCTC 12251 / CI) TaxID=572480 RepID=D5V5N1_ARCNC|nr:response regulator transcription factor [Arcobacter nitrofigilis]ADG92067.1 two component transcriptional regulator, winged helix family [Arcobacter nitrofigilis DSM 7299]
MTDIISRLKSKTILLVEDEKVIRENIASMLKFFFKEVYIANDGYDGIEKYENYLPDIVMTDLKMPNMGGFELITELKNRKSTSFTIIVSAHTDTDLLINAIHNGVDRYIVKPVIEDDLFDTFKAFLEKLDNVMPQIIKLSENLFIDIDKSEIILDEKSIHLNKKENMLLKLLCKDLNKTISYEEIEYQVWGSESMSLSAIRSVVRDLRKKIGQEYISNVSGVGYRMK